MKLQASLVIVLTCLLFSNHIIAQDESGVTFNKVKPADFSLDKIAVDTTYGAVIIADIGRSYFEGNTKGWFSLIYEHKRRVRFIDKKAFDLATVEIPLYKEKHGGNEEKLESLKATTYNLVDGKVEETKLDKDNVFKDKLDETHTVRKFTMPAVKEGSIIEYSYKITSDFLFNLHSWSFQGSYPRLWSEYRVSLPSFFNYVSLNQGYHPFHLQKSSEKMSSYFVREVNAGHDQLYTLTSNDKTTRWVIKNVPAMKEESFTSSIANHLSKITFQLAGYNFPGQLYKPIMGDWQTISAELLKDKDFGASLTAGNNWSNEEMKALLANNTGRLEQAKRIYRYVQTNIKNKGTRGIYLSQTPRETFKNKNGHVPDVNMLLVNLLSGEGMAASPVLVSTRANGVTNDMYPLIHEFNYVICKLKIDNTTYYLDASQPYLGFNKLPSYVYNGHARTISSSFEPEYFLPDNIFETKVTKVVLGADETQPAKWKGTLQSTLGYYESSRVRESILKGGEEAFTKKISDAYTGEFSAADVKLDKLEVNEEPVQVSYKINIENNNADIIYFNPMIKEGLTENYFKSENRLYPVEMPYKIDETYLLTIQIPQGYVIDELPKSTRAPFNEKEALFEYLVSRTEKEINLKVVLKFEKATFTREDYEGLRGYFDYIVKKHAEQIVFKKK